VKPTASAPGRTTSVWPSTTPKSQRTGAVVSVDKIDRSSSVGGGGPRSPRHRRTLWSWRGPASLARLAG
jgi:hypothetical protein